MDKAYKKWRDECDKYARKCKFWLGMCFGWCFSYYAGAGGIRLWIFGFLVVFVFAMVRTLQYGKRVNSGADL